ncbi:MAG: deoxynucleoside kinase [Psychrilyobacter sp.]|nr:deoxynucleoside kinase [Psychrilyobacter sp.]
MGKLIVIEGTDSSGKQTQTELLYERYKKMGKKVMKITFPNYESDSSAPVKMYLNGDFGGLEEANIYAVSTMYAVDRYASFKTIWEEFYNNDGIIISDRYTTSNMVHQASKFENKDEKNSYLEWLADLEYEKMGIPKPNKVIFLNMPTDMAFKLMEDRKNKITGEDKKDIHENDKDYMKKSHDNACYVASKYSWNEVMCVEEERLKSVEEIGREVYKICEEI